MNRRIVMLVGALLALTLSLYIMLPLLLRLAGPLLAGYYFGDKSSISITGGSFGTDGLYAEEVTLNLFESSTGITEISARGLYIPDLFAAAPHIDIESLDIKLTSLPASGSDGEASAELLPDFLSRSTLDVRQFTITLAELLRMSGNIHIDNDGKALHGNYSISASAVNPEASLQLPDGALMKGKFSAATKDLSLEQIDTSLEANAAGFTFANTTCTFPSMNFNASGKGNIVLSLITEAHCSSRTESLPPVRIQCDGMVGKEVTCNGITPDKEDLSFSFSLPLKESFRKKISLDQLKVTSPKILNSFTENLNTELLLLTEVELSGSAEYESASEQLVLHEARGTFSGSYGGASFDRLALQHSESPPVISFREEYPRLHSGSLSLKAKEIAYKNSSLACLVRELSGTFIAPHRFSISGEQECLDDMKPLFSIPFSCKGSLSQDLSCSGGTEESALSYSFDYPLDPDISTATINSLIIRSGAPLLAFKELTDEKIDLSKFIFNGSGAFDTDSRILIVEVNELKGTGTYDIISFAEAELLVKNKLTFNFSDSSPELPDTPLSFTADRLSYSSTAFACAASGVSAAVSNLSNGKVLASGSVTCSVQKVDLPAAKFDCKGSLQSSINCQGKSEEQKRHVFDVEIPADNSGNFEIRSLLLNDPQIVSEYFQLYLPGLILSDGNLALSGTYDTSSEVLTMLLRLNQVSGTYGSLPFEKLSVHPVIQIAGGVVRIPPASVSIESAVAGVPFSSLKAILRLKTGDIFRCELTEISAGLFSGKVSVPKLKCGENALKQSFEMDLAEIELSDLSEWLAYPSFDAKGLISGNVPFILADGGVAIRNASLSLLSAGGYLSILLPESYDSVKVPGFGFSVRTLLRGLTIEEAAARFSYSNDMLQSAIVVLGFNPAIESGRPVKLNVNLEQDIGALVKTILLAKQLQSRENSSSSGVVNE